MPNTSSNGAVIPEWTVRTLPLEALGMKVEDLAERKPFHSARNNSCSASTMRSLFSMARYFDGLMDLSRLIFEEGTDLRSSIGESNELILVMSLMDAGAPDGGGF